MNKTKKARLADFVEAPVEQPEVTVDEPVILDPVEDEPIEQTGNLSAAEQMVARADETIADIEQQLRDIGQRITSAHVELETFPVGRQERTTKLREAREILKDVERTHIQAESYAKLAQGTTNEQGAVSAVSKAHKDLEARKEALATIEQEIAEAEQLAADQEQELLAIIEQLQAQQEQLQTTLYQTRDARRQVHAELGEQRYAAVMQEAEEHQKRIDDLRSQLLAAQVDFHDYLESALPTLRDWSSHYIQARELLPASDGTSRVIDAALYYIDTLIRERHALKTNNRDMQIPKVRELSRSWLAFLVASDRELEMLITPQSDALARIQDRRMQLEYIQTEYKKVLAQL